MASKTPLNTDGIHTMYVESMKTRYFFTDMNDGFFFNSKPLDEIPLHDLLDYVSSLSNWGIKTRPKYPILDTIPHANIMKYIEQKLNIERAFIYWEKTFSYDDFSLPLNKHKWYIDMCPNKKDKKPMGEYKMLMCKELLSTTLSK